MPFGFVLWAASLCGQIKTFIKPDQINPSDKIGAVGLFQDKAKSDIAIVYQDRTLSSSKALYAVYSQNGNLESNSKLSNSYSNPEPKEFFTLKNKSFAVSGYAKISGGSTISYTTFYDSNLTEFRTYGIDTSFEQLTQFSDSKIAAIAEFHDTASVSSSEFGFSALNYLGELEWTITLRSILGLSPSDSVKHYVGSIDTYNDTLYALITSKTEVNMIAKINTLGNHFSLDSIGVGNSAYAINVGPNGSILTYDYGTYPNYTLTHIHRNWKNEVTWVFKGADSTLYRSDFKDGIIEGDTFSFISRMVHLNASSSITSHSRLTQLSTVDGALLFTKEYTDASKSFSMQNLIRSNDGGFLISGMIEEDSPWISYLFKTDSVGNIYESDIGTIFPPTNSIYQSRERATFSLHPNPSSTNLTLELNTNQTVNYTLQNLNGQTMLEGSFEHTTQIRTSSLPNGIYFLHLQCEGILETRKIVVQR